MRVAYFTKTPTRCFLTIKQGPGGQILETVQSSGKREARAYCKARGIQPWNF